jgi:transketolase
VNNDANNIINTIKLLAIDMIDVANSGHPGIVLDAAPIMYTLYANHLRIDPNNPNWINRDRFVMSCGHGSALLYATLFMAGYNISLEDLVRFRQIDSKTPGHPELNKTPGVDYTTGMLGEGFAAAVGMAMAEKYEEALINKSVTKQKLINHYVYCLVSDGDLEEGISYEAANLAGMYGLNNLIVLYDSNDVTLDGNLAKTSKENFIKRFDACDWNTDYVKDGSNIREIDKALNKAKRNKNRPTIIEIKTIIGKDSFNQGSNIVHGKPLSKDDIINLHQIYKINTSKFEVTTKYVDEFRDTINKRMAKSIMLWKEYAETFHNTNYPDVQILDQFFLNNKISLNFDANNFKIQSNYQDDLRESNSQIMNIIASRTPFFIGGSADLGVSCKTNLIKYSDFGFNNYMGRNIYFGIREHAMGAIINGMATYHLRPFASTFLVFSDYLKASIRNAALMKIPATYIFTNDAVNVGEDGPTHEPVEQLATLRNIPDLDVYRPGDINEVIGSWDAIMKLAKPAALVISKQNIHVLGGTNGSATLKGGYIVKKEKAQIDGIIIATGSELMTALLVENSLKDKYDLRIVSMPCQELFLRQDATYQNLILPPGNKIIVIEAATNNNWIKFTTNDNIIGINNFGYSGKPNDVLKKMQFDTPSIINKVKELLK